MRISPYGFSTTTLFELYLKAFLRQSGHTVDQLNRRFGHKTEKMVARASKLGLTFLPIAEEVFSIMGDTDVVIRSRYIRTGPFTWPTTDALNDTCEDLRRKVGEALKRAGTNVRI